MKANRWALISAGGIRDSGHEELQTDVMSFMAILGFCLMAIFAIVQSIPLAPSDNRPALETVITLQKDIQDLSKRLLQLQQLSNTESKRIQQLQHQTKLLQQQKNNSQQQLAHKALQLQATEKYLTDVKQRIEKQGQRLSQINSDLWEGKQTLSSLRRKVKLETRILNEQQDELLGLESQLAELSIEIAPATPLEPPPSGDIAVPEIAEEPVKAVPKSDPIPQPKPVPKPEQQTVEKQASHSSPRNLAQTDSQLGFSLRFYSDHALLQLLQQNRVQLFAMTRRQAWQLTSIRQGYQLSDSPKPRSFYEMASTTVPNVLVRELQLQRSIYNPADLTWGVVLPQEIRNQISQLMSNYSYGTLVITDQALVQREGS